jgi:hypothetical protein
MIKTYRVLMSSRCTSTGRKCDGYAQSSTEHGLGRSDAGVVDSSPPRSISIHQVLGDNIQYLEFYHHCAGPKISSKFDQGFWSRTPLQIAQSELCVRHALIALSCLTKTETGTLKDARSGLLAVSKQKTMLAHYNKAVKQLVQRMSEPSYSTELGLVCCLLFICLEYLRGNYYTALEHYKSGLKMIAVHRSNPALTATKTLSSNLVEGTLIPIFTRNMATAIIYGLPEDQFTYTTQYPAGDQQYRFDTLLEAEVAAHSTQNMFFALTRILGTKVVTQEPHTKEELQSQQDCLEHLRAWMRGIEDLERRVTFSLDDAIVASRLKALHHINYIFAALILLKSQTDFDQYLDRFKLAVEHIRFVLDSTESSASQNPAANFTFEMGVIPGLYMAACRCRCPVTRREALAMLKRNPPREGLWDAQQHYVVAKRVIEFEERELDPVTGWPVESARIWSTMINGEMDGNGRFPVDFAIGHWGEGRGTPPLPPGGILPHDPSGRIWREWFVL